MNRLLIAVFIAFASFKGYANWAIGFNYTELSESGEIDVNVSAISASLAYAFPIGDKLSIVPEIKYGLGVGDDSSANGALNIDLEVNHLFGASIRAQYDVAETVYMFASVSHLTVDSRLIFSSSSSSESDTSNDFGAGIGAGWLIFESTSIELSYERFDDTNVFSAGFRYAF
ncbi:hypothetical protein PN836_002420 [Ningiella sp. W23]|uniref:hypothetical protein n=1 Tax=Ningiella sp. W23 TaxID=3023715 RepID=UPI00375837A4